MANETKIIEIRIDLLKGLEDINRLQLEIKALNDLQKEHVKSGKAIDEAYSARTVKIRELTQQMSTLIRETTNEAKATTEKIGYMQKLEAEVSNLTLAYKRLTKEELEGDKGNQVLTNLKSKRDELAKLNQAYGNYTHDVGNYAKGTNQLSIMMGQVMKEAPNFAVSARIGIMSLSNNLVPLAEAIKAVKLQNAELVAQGKATQSIMTTLGKSIFGLTGIMSMLVVAFQLFGEPVMKWIGSLFSADKQVRQTTESLYKLESAQKVINSTMKDGGGVYGDATKSIQQMNVELKAAKGNHTEETIVLEKYNKGLGENFGKATSVAGALDLIASKKDAYIDAMLKMSFANAFLSKSSEDIVKQVDVMTKSQGELVRNAGYDYKKLYDEVKDYDEKIANLKSYGEYGKTLKYFEEQRYIAALKIGTIEENERAKQLSDLKKHQSLMSNQYEKYYTEYLNELERAGIKSDKITKEKNKGSFDYEQKLREANAKAVVNSMQRELDEVKVNIQKKQDELEKAKKKGLVTEQQYSNLTKAYAEESNREQNTIIDKYREANLKSFISYTNELDKSINSQIDEFWKRVKETDDYVNKLYKGQVDTAQNNYDLIKLKGIDDAEAHKQLLETQRQFDIDNAKKTGESELSINKRYAQLKKNVDTEALNAKLDMASSVTSGLVTLLGKETEAGKLAAAANVSIEGYKSAFKTGAAAAEYFAHGNIPMGILAGVETGIIVANTIKSIADIYAVNTDVSKDVTSKTTVTSKYHNSGIAGDSPMTKNQDDEVTATLLRGERVLSLQQTGVFNSILGNLSNLGGSASITNNIGTQSNSSIAQLEEAFTRVIEKMPNPQISWTEFERQAQRQQQLKNNLVVI